MRKIVIQALDSASRLLAGIAIFRLVSDAWAIDLSDTLSTVLDLFRSLFHPLFDATLGALLQIFSIDLSNLIKDLIIVYLLMTFAMLRAFRRMYYRSPEVKLDGSVRDFRMLGLRDVFLLLWPIILFPLLGYFVFDFARRKVFANKQFQNKLWSEGYVSDLGDIVIEIAVVALIVLALLSVNSLTVQVTV